MGSRSRLAATIGAIVGCSLLAFICGLLLTVTVIVPAREGGGLAPEPGTSPTAVESPSVAVGPIAPRTPVAPSATPTVAVITATPTAGSPVASAAPTETVTPGQQPTATPEATPTQSAFSFYYVEGSRVEEEQCFQPYLQGWVKDASGGAVDGVTLRWQYWNNAEYAISGDPRFVWQPGEFKFTYYAENPGLETEFVLQVVERADNPAPLSEPLLIHYAGCDTMGQITNIVFKQR
jgi:hypothetical protein